MANISLKQLRYFEALARHGHFGRAADTCSISQPALSMQIKDLETDLGILLFERGGKDVRLTRFGEEFATRARAILNQVDDLGDLARASSGKLSGSLRIGVIPTIAPYLLPKVITVLGQVYPGLEIHVRETLTSRLMQELSEGRIDTAIVALPVSEPTFTEVPLFCEDFLLVRPDAETDMPVPNPEELRHMRLLLLEEGHCFRDQALSFCNLRSPLAGDGLDASSLSTLVQMVGSGIGVTLIPEMAVTIETRAAPVVVSRFPAPEPNRQIGMIWRKSNPLSKQFVSIADRLRLGLIQGL